MKYLLDSCTLIWLVNGYPQLSAEARKACGDSSARIFVSAGSAWEIALKHARGKLGLQLPVSEWWPKALERLGVIELPITGRAAIASAALPRLHNDPFDRVLIATAQEYRLTILSPDPAIRCYPDLSAVW